MDGAVDRDSGAGSGGDVDQADRAPRHLHRLDHLGDRGIGGRRLGAPSANAPAEGAACEGGGRARGRRSRCGPCGRTWCERSWPDSGSGAVSRADGARTRTAGGVSPLPRPGRPVRYRPVVTGSCEGMPHSLQEPSYTAIPLVPGEVGAEGQYAGGHPGSAAEVEPFPSPRQRPEDGAQFPGLRIDRSRPGVRQTAG